MILGEVRGVMVLAAYFFPKLRMQVLPLILFPYFSVRLIFTEKVSLLSPLKEIELKPPVPPIPPKTI